MVTEIYHRDLTMEHYEIPYLRYPYVSFYTGRGCPGHCVYCLLDTFHPLALPGAERGQCGG